MGFAQSNAEAKLSYLNDLEKRWSRAAGARAKHCAAMSRSTARASSTVEAHSIALACVQGKVTCFSSFAK
jgi:hypothetical protein